MTPLNAREWLEALRAANGPEADFAAEILDTWCTEDEIEEQVTDQDAQLEAVRQVLVNGGVLRERDAPDDLAGVVAMFVPPVVVGAG